MSNIVTLNRREPLRPPTIDTVPVGTLFQYPMGKKVYMSLGLGVDSGRWFYRIVQLETGALYHVDKGKRVDPLFPGDRVTLTAGDYRDKG